MHGLKLDIKVLQGTWLNSKSSFIASGECQDLLSGSYMEGGMGHSSSQLVLG
jgi:hypothetical protein